MAGARKAGLVPDVSPDALAADMLEALLVNRRFEKFLVDSVVERIVARRADDVDSVYGSTSIASLPPPPVSSRSEAVSRGAEALTSLVASVTETFLRSVDLAICDFGMEANRDAATLFSARVHIDRFLLSEKIQINRFEQIVRRLSSLLKLFATRISTPFHLANSAFFASSLCDMLYRFEEYCAVYEKKVSTEFEKLRTSIDDFYFVVVRHLNQMVLTRQDMLLKKKKEEELERRRAHERATRRTKTAPPQARSEPRSFGYLLPRELNEKRRALLGTAGGSAKRASASSHGARRQVGESAATDIERKWAKLLESEVVLRDSMCPGEEGRAALRLAREITKEVVNELAERVDRVCTARPSQSAGKVKDD